MKKGTNKHSISKWKHKLLIAILTMFIFINNAKATQIGTNKYKPDRIIVNTEGKTPKHEIVSNLNWWGQTGSASKWAIEYNYLDLDPNKRYTFSGAMYFDTNVHAFNTPILSISNVYCTVQNTYNYNYQLMKDLELDSGNIGHVYDFGFYNTNISSLISFTCENIPAEVPASYINVVFPDNINSLRITELYINESGNNIIVDQQKEMNDKLKETNEKLEEFIESDLSEEDKQKPNQEGFDSYQESENELKDKMEQADLNNISIGIDANSSSWIWDTLTSLIRSHSVVFGMFIAILSIGIIKLALGR